MITNFDLSLCSANPALPLPSRSVLVGSALTVRVVRLPATVGSLAVTGVTVSAENSSGVIFSVAAVATGSVWQATIPASHFSAAGLVRPGLQITATGTDESGSARSWILGRGDLAILSADGTYTSAGERITLKYRGVVATAADLPADPEPGDLYQVAGSGFVFYTGSSWAAVGPTFDFADVLPLSPDGASTFEIASKLNQVLSILKG